MIQSFLPILLLPYSLLIQCDYIHLANSSPPFFPLYILFVLFAHYHPNTFISFTLLNARALLQPKHIHGLRETLHRFCQSCISKPPHVQLQHAFIHQVKINLAALASSTNSNS